MTKPSLPDRICKTGGKVTVAATHAAAVAEAAIAGGLARNPMNPRDVEKRCRDLVYEGAVGL